jgi:hypothetical protein
MHKLIKLALILPLCAASVAAQTLPETQAFIIREFKSFETDKYSVKDISFSEGGMIFSFVSGVSFQSDHKVSLSLDSVNVFMARRTTPNGDYLYDLAAEARGKSGKLQVNGNPVFGAVRLLENSSNKTKMQQLEKAFAHLKKLLGTEDSRTVF